MEAAGELRVVLRGAGEVLRMGDPPYRRKLQTYLELREDLERRCPGAEYFDLRFRDRIFVHEAVAARRFHLARRFRSPARNRRAKPVQKAPLSRKAGLLKTRLIKTRLRPSSPVSPRPVF